MYKAVLFCDEQQRLLTLTQSETSVQKEYPKKQKEIQVILDIKYKLY